MNKNVIQGFTLVEIMIALVISMILMAGVLTIMATSKRTYGLQGEVSYLQDGTRFVMEDITFGARMAGYFGCSGSLPAGLTTPPPISGENDKEIVDAKTDSTNFKSKDYPKSDVLILSYFGGVQSKLELDTGASAVPPPEEEGEGGGGGTEGGGTEGEGTEGGGGAAGGGATSAALSVKQIKAEKAFIMVNFVPEANVIPITPDSPKPDPASHRLVFSDCSGSQFFDIGSVGNSRITVANTFGRQFGWPLDIFIVPKDDNDFSSITYEVKMIDKTNPPDGNSTGPADGFALFKNNQLLVDGVQNLQVRYGKMSGVGNAITYTSSPDWPGETVSLRVTLLMRTPNKRYDIDDTEEKDFVLDADLPVFNPGDTKILDNELGFRHRLFTNTINIRN